MKGVKRKNIIILIFLAVLGGLVFLFTSNKDSKIDDFPVPMSAIYIKEDKLNVHRYFSVIPINKAKGWKYLGENGHTIEFQKGDRKIIILHLPEDRNYYLYEEQ
ncbi:MULTISPECIES: hypothetical protein [Bacillus]|uniref:hypothetical protein n=1 Tax=Bacillus TaxID=1386 RepID=UPI000B49E8DD|nr:MULTISPECIES: hypothetical protein [Bacillus]MDH4423819.1 hypothetical protein [Bacillus cereus]PGL81654.1 hypothetical protein CN931_16505 [Bacillus sp. AFS054943]PGX11310.1 hypothetical protein COE07_12620 [Bacillus sp. AFS033286]PGZ74644.1 hypothetical protein COE49_08150 [Bacillus sp. AFS029637]